MASMNMKSTLITALTTIIMMAVTPALAQKENGFKSDAPKKMYANFPAGIHSMYIGEVVNAWKK